MSTQSNTLTGDYQKELRLLVWLSYKKKWTYNESANSSQEESIVNGGELKSASFKISSKTLHAFLEGEEEGSIF